MATEQNEEGDSVDVKALRSRFTSQTRTSETSSRDSGSPQSPRPGFGGPILTEEDLAHRRPTPTVPPPTASPGPVWSPRPEPTADPVPSRPASGPGVRASVQPAEPGKVKLKGELLQNLMLKHQGPPAPRPGLALGPTTTPLPLQRSSAVDGTPLRRPLPPGGLAPLKPKRPPKVTLEAFLRLRRGPGPPGPPGPRPADEVRPAVVGPPKPLQPIRPDRTIRTIRSDRTIRPDRPVSPIRAGGPPLHAGSIAADDQQDVYDDVEGFEDNEAWSDSGSHSLDGDEDDVYEFIDEEQLEMNRLNTEKLNKKEEKSRKAQEKKNQVERRKKENELKKNFQLQGEVEVLHTARVRHDWPAGGKLELSVRRGESVEILRVKDNPGGRWLARSLGGSYGYISNSCVDVDYEAVKRNLLQSRQTASSSSSSPQLPPLPPPDPLMSHGEGRSRDGTLQDDEDYDDVEPITDEFPPPPPDIRDHKVEKELKKRFKYEGPLRVLHTMMVDPNGVLKKPGGKDLPVTHGEVVDVVQITNCKKALCCNRFGKYGYVSRSLLLTMERDIYDDVDYPDDVYDNDSLHAAH
ncbi:FYN-binding protein 1 isoform X3 [Pseudoliparis swirei]|uniref:FYN-binding protein 1 isoform X3 n=1 Tax=Pseudoliparis swirei TaxID=2059687 RepID=UPI0024BE1F90|nr:FYN-binding protein 1 isoform X3 [Pseudoliparis swirei]